MSFSPFDREMTGELQDPRPEILTPKFNWMKK